MSLTNARTAVASDLWNLVQTRLWIDPADLARAIEAQIARGDLDFRTRLLIRDGIDALTQVWGSPRVERWISDSPHRDRLLAIRTENLGVAGFPLLVRQLMEPTRPETIRQFLRELGTLTQQPARLAIGGSAALILREQLARQTQDIDIVDEVPPAIRENHEAVRRLSERYQLQIAHFQSHYLPAGWEGRLSFLDRNGPLDVYLVDSYDIALSKLMSRREKDRDDLRALVPQLQKQRLIEQLRQSCAAMLSEPKLRDNAERNWYILFGEPLPA